ncbi:MAG: class I SAM-dependent methyltransferase [Goleter apudmare HA4340-LM2]|jgi:SAM-dependent methyltransferase|nr:class I SAM-dependent methyltransferase [Goleter apudmare HA4340-LM2]
MNINIYNENRNFAQIKKHYEIEKGLAQKLLASQKEERKYLYTYLYDQLFQLVPHHPQIFIKENTKIASTKIAQKMKLLSKYLSKNVVFLEIGAGDCKLSFEVAQDVKQVYAVDVSEEIVKHLNPPANFQLIISDGCSIPTPENSVNVAYSNQLMEHLHPDDALEQLRNIYQAITPGGYYICITPNRLSGPHDISRHFDEVATGFHLKEYTYSELSNLFAQVGFGKLVTYIGGAGIYFRFPLVLIKLLEHVFCIMPFLLRQKLARSLLGRALLGIIIVAQK